MTRLILQAQNISYRYLSQPEPLFTNINLSVYSGDCLAILGQNGSGKSTLLNVLAGTLVTDNPVTRHAHQQACIQQNDTLQGDSTLLESLLIVQPRTELARLHNAIRQQETTNLPDPMHYANLISSFSDQGGFDLLQRITNELSALGFHESSLEKPITQFSGGERRILKLMSAFISQPDLIFLDEPTNYLDEPATHYLIHKLQTHTGASILISHDRWFLDQTSNRISELKHRTLTHHNGNYSSFKAHKEETHTHKTRQKQKLESEITKLKEMERTYKIWGARKEKEKSGALDKGFIGARAARLRKRGIMAKARLGERIEVLEKEKPWIDKHYRVQFMDVRVPAGVCLNVSGVSYAYAEQPVLRNVSFTLAWGERIAITGRNGSGKSTLIKLLRSELASQQGSVQWSRGVEVGYLPQVAPLNAPNAAALFDESDDAQARNLLGALGVKGDAFYAPLNALSEGQQRKVRLAHLMLSSANVLILDEPTTHLDYESVEMLEQALLTFKGSLLLVTHDRYLRERLAQRTLSLNAAQTHTPAT